MGSTWTSLDDLAREHGLSSRSAWAAVRALLRRERVVYLATAAGSAAVLGREGLLLLNAAASSALADALSAAPETRASCLRSLTPSEGYARRARGMAPVVPDVGT